MRTAMSYRGARRNTARSGRKLARAEKRQGALIEWRDGRYAAAANQHAKLNLRAEQANSAREAASKALVEHGILGFKRRADVVNDAFLKFYRSVTPTRSVTRILRELNRQKRAA